MTSGTSDHTVSYYSSDVFALIFSYAFALITSTSHMARRRAGGAPPHGEVRREHRRWTRLPLTCTVAGGSVC